MTDDLVRKTVDRDTLVRVLDYFLFYEDPDLPGKGVDGPEILRMAEWLADELLASGVLTDAAQVRTEVRRAVAEEIAEAIRHGGCRVVGDAVRIAREIGGSA